MNRLNIDSLAATLRNAPQAPLVFYLDGNPISAGYHVTEIKHARINSLDCGKGTDEWDEIIVQLLDGPLEANQEHMHCEKFLHIVNTAFESVPVTDAGLYFEFGVQNAPLQKLVAISAELQNDAIHVTLQGERALCKPYERAKRALAEGAAEPGCCAGSAQKPKSAACCGTTNETQSGACCG